MESMVENKVSQIEMPQISLASARVNAKLTQDEAAIKLKVSRATVFNWENGKSAPDAKMFRRIGELYKIPTDYIFLP